LRESIANGQLNPGAALSERALCDRFGVSRMTARQALRALRDEGLLYSERGRGTFVAEPKFTVQTRQLLGFSEDMKQRGFTPSSRVVSFRRSAATPDIAEQLQLPADEEVFEIVRLRLADKVPMAHETCCLPVRLCPQLKRADVERGSLYNVLEESYRVSIEWADEVLEAAVATRQEAQVLALPARAPVLVVQRTVYSEERTPIEVVRSVYRGDRYQAVIHLKRKKNRG
jgi:GntR family transcriptional regulator